MSSENEKLMRNLALSVYVQKVINNVGVCLGPWGSGSGDVGGCPRWVMQTLLRRSRVVPCGMAGALAGVPGIFWFLASSRVGAGCSP